MGRLIEIEGELVAPYDTDKAYHFYDGRTKAWLPKSQVEWYPSENNEFVGTMVIPEWLAEEKGLE